VCENCTIAKKELEKDFLDENLIKCTRCKKELNRASSKVNFKAVCEECTEKNTYITNLAH
jgi:hypothetical protein